MVTSALDTADCVVFATRVRPLIERALADSLPGGRNPANLILDQAMRDAVFPGGKRLRPTLSLMASGLVSVSNPDALRAAVAVEYLHNSALIFDDLPSMDNARERRGRTCLHLRYGEGMAIMAALALMNTAYKVIAEKLPAGGAHAAFLELAGSIGALICGQAAELAQPFMQEPSPPAEHRWAVHSKTSALFCLSLTLGPILSAASESDIAALAHAGELLGEAYQIFDDCRDLEADTLLMHRGRNATLAMRIGRESAEGRVCELLEEARSVLVANFGNVAPVSRLCGFAKSICNQ